MARIQTFDHCGFVVEDIPRAHKWYGQLFGAKPLWMANLNLNAYKGWPIISFVDMGAHRFELCLAMKPLAPLPDGYTLLRIGFVLPQPHLEPLRARLGELEIPYRELTNSISGVPIERTIQLRDPDGNILDLSTRTDVSDGAAAAQSGIIPLTDISHIALEVTDLDVAERFYQTVIGLDLVTRDTGELGHGRLILRNDAGQLLFLEKVDQISPRARFTAPDRSTAPDPDGYVGAHLAMTVASADYDEMYAALQGWGVKSDGDIRKGERAAGEKSDYFYDPAGNRIQLVAFAPKG
jgi:catechol 2,3-dioxygenase-like lactoylglutathione lyase family enzyme